ncbi:MAG: homoserine O-acetyltransferase MetA [Anaerovoracaceae bacterium]
MPLIIPNKLPAAGTLKKENIFTMKEARAISQQIRPLKILIVNLMPTKIATETQLARVLANTPLQVEMTLLRMDSHKQQNTSEEHMQSFYQTLEEIENQKFDGMILTGAPVEQINFEDVDYWWELKEILDYAEKNIYSSMHICWGAQAALYHKYKIPKYQLDEKIFGVFQQKVLRAKSPLLRGFDEKFYAPHSRHTETKKEDVQKHPELRILAESKEAGLHIVATDNGKEVYVFGHQEYDKNTLGDEYFRDIDKGLDIKIPENYFKDDNPKKEPMFRWRSHAHLLFSNWLNYYVYQETPFDLSDI